jgi:hypothetical protein
MNSGTVWEWVMTLEQLRSLAPIAAGRLAALARFDPVTAERCSEWLSFNTTALCDVPSTLPDGLSVTWSMVGAVRGEPVAQVTLRPTAAWYEMAAAATVEELLSVAPVPAPNAIRAPTWQELHPNVAAP